VENVSDMDIREDGSTWSHVPKKWRENLPPSAPFPPASVHSNAGRRNIDSYI